MKAAPDTDSYIADFPPETQKKLREMQAIIRSAAPQAKELISYAMPAFKQHGVLVYFAGYEHHIGFYPTSSGIAAFEKELTDFKTSKGTVQFPLDKPLPKELIRRMVQFRVDEDLQKEAMKKKK